MKVLLVTSGKLPRYFEEFLFRFRYHIGTCDHVLLSRKSKRSNQNILNTQRKIQKYDRSIFFYQDSDALVEELRYFSDFDELTLMSVQNETEEHFAVLKTFFKHNPWVRWFGSDHKAFNYYWELGVDVYLLPKVFVKSAVSSTHTQANQQINFYILGKVPSLNNNLSQYINLKDLSGYDDIHLFIKNYLQCGDFVLFSSDEYLDEEVFSTIMSQGGIVLISRADTNLPQHPFVMNRNCFMLDNLGHFDQTVRYLIQNEVREKLIEESFEDLRQFSPGRLAEETARLIAFNSRDKSLYSPMTWLRKKFR